ncbi:MAG: hypothetical protein ACYCZF_03330 [Anaerolineae bacterium]
MGYNEHSVSRVKHPQYSSWLLVAMVFILVTSVVSCSPRTALLGKWQAEDGSSIEFLRDGTVMVKTLVTVAGKYSFIDDTRIKIEFEGLLGLAGPQIYTVRIDDGQLSMTDSNSIVTSYTKVN